MTQQAFVMLHIVTLCCGGMAGLAKMFAESSQAVSSAESVTDSPARTAWPVHRFPGEPASVTVHPWSSGNGDASLIPQLVVER